MEEGNVVRLACLGLLLCSACGARAQRQDSECQDASAWRDSRGSPEVFQVDSETALLDWGGLWTDLRWEGCVERVVVVVKGGGRDEEEELEVGEEGLEARNMTVSVDPCAEARFAVKVFFLSSDVEEVTSFKSKIGFKTFKPPRAKATASEKATVVRGGGGGGGGGEAKIDLTTADVKVAFNDVVEDPACRRVIAAELRVRKIREEEEEKEEEEGGVWTVARTMTGFRRRLEETVTGLDDLCAGYEVALALLGAERGASAVVTLGSVAPPAPERMGQAWESGFRWGREELEVPRGLEVRNATEGSISVEWEENGAEEGGGGGDSACSSGYLVELKDENGNKVRILPSFSPLLISKRLIFNCGTQYGMIEKQNTIRGHRRFPTPYRKGRRRWRTGRRRRPLSKASIPAGSTP